MATYTTNYQFIKPSQGEVINVDTINSNYNKIDSVIAGNISGVLTGVLQANAWGLNAQTIVVSGAEVDGYVYLAFPVPANFQSYAKAGIYPLDVTIANRMTFNCTKVPSDNITINVLKIKVGV